MSFDEEDISSVEQNLDSDVDSFDDSFEDSISIDQFQKDLTIIENKNGYKDETL